MNDRAAFEKVAVSDKQLYGPRKLLLAGFGPEAQQKFMQLLKMLGFSDLPLVWLSADQSETALSELVSTADGSGLGNTSELPRSLIVCGITENELHRLIDGCRQAGMKQALWAVLTPASEGWRLKDLLAELAAEREAIATRKDRGV
ncbi:MAG: DUF3783 domain-containing protein [Desulfobacteraceae bacterium]|nr:DUF3783 domain-containing protein [Desulfobacteraceae bacterium]